MLHPCRRASRRQNREFWVDVVSPGEDSRPGNGRVQGKCGDQEARLSGDRGSRGASDPRRRSLSLGRGTWPLRSGQRSMRFASRKGPSRRCDLTMLLQKAVKTSLQPKTSDLHARGSGVRRGLAQSSSESGLPDVHRGNRPGVGPAASRTALLCV